VHVWPEEFFLIVPRLGQWLIYLLFVPDEEFGLLPRLPCGPQFVRRSLERARAGALERHLGLRLEADRPQDYGDYAIALADDERVLAASHEAQGRASEGDYLGRAGLLRTLGAVSLLRLHLLGGEPDGPSVSPRGQRLAHTLVVADRLAHGFIESLVDGRSLLKSFVDVPFSPLGRHTLRESSPRRFCFLPC